jgi:D-alanyl-D-alanine carboxypeptidase (penicillin-binding protein 5/6)
VRKAIITSFIGLSCFFIAQAGFAEDSMPLPDNALSLPIAATAPSAPQPVLIPQAPSIDAKAYVILDVATGNVIAQSNMDERLEPASLTKLMSTYVVFSTLKSNAITLDDDVRVSETAWRAEGSRMFIKVGDTIKVSDLIQGDIVASGNDATIALSEHVAGSEASFVEMMNAQAQLLGMSGSHFVDATGLPAQDHYTTAADLAKLSRAIILSFPDQYHWFSEKWFEYGGIKQPNRNRLLWQFPGTDGLKTGHTDAAGYCLIASAVKGNTRLLVVVMGAPTDKERAADAIKLFTYGFRFFQNTTLFDANTTLATARVWKGQEKEVKLGVTSPVSVTLPVGAEKLVKNTIEVNPNLTAPIVKGQTYGKVTATYEGKVVTTAPLVALEDDAKGGFFRGVADSIAKLFHHGDDKKNDK